MNIAIYTNILTPYRKYFFDALYAECKKNGDNFTVLLMADTEPNRRWSYNDLKTEYTSLLDGFTINIKEMYIHFNKEVYRQLKKLDLDVLICAGSYLCPGVWLAQRWKKKLGYKCFYWSESHLNEARNYNQALFWVRENLRREVYKKFDGFLYAGKLSLQFIKRYANDDAKLFFLPNLVDETKYYNAAQQGEAKRKENREKYGVKASQTAFICPARLSPAKGIDNFIHIANKCKNRDAITLLIAGDGVLKEKIEEKAQQYDIDLRLLGFKKQDEIVDLYSMSDVFLLPSLSDPNPLTCIEALWSGLPLFVSEHVGNYPEVIRQGENGYVFSYSDEKSAVECLEKIIESSDEWRQEAKKVSLEIANANYNTPEVTVKLLTWCREND